MNQQQQNHQISSALQSRDVGNNQSFATKIAEIDQLLGIFSTSGDETRSSMRNCAKEQGKIALPSKSWQWVGHLGNQLPTSPAKSRSGTHRGKGSGNRQETPGDKTLRIKEMKKQLE